MAFPENNTGVNEPLSVSDALALAKIALESITLPVVGEISDLSNNPRYKAVYFTLADEGAALPCLMWRSAYDHLGIELKSGMQVEVKGRFSLYSAKGRMQFEVRHMSLAGEGQLRAQVAALAAKLRAQGLMDEDRKLPLPEIPQTIALVTSPQGKAVHDVIRTLKRRFPLTKVLLFGTKVEGKDAPTEISKALQAALESEAEVVLLVRGGGSYEDLMPFNDEALALAIAGAHKPIVTGIGHEPDTSLADMVSSLRASTPTAAAEAIVPDAQELLASLQVRQASLASGMQRHCKQSRQVLEQLESSPVFAQDKFLTAQQALNLEQAALRLDRAIPTGILAASQAIKESELRLQGSISKTVEVHARLIQQTTSAIKTWKSSGLAPYSMALASAAASLEGLSPLAVLARGYSLSYNEQGTVVQSIEQVQLNEQLTVKLSDGTIRVNVVAKEHQEES